MEFWEIFGIVIFVLLFFPGWGAWLKRGSVSRQFGDLIKGLDLKIEQVRGHSVTLVGQHRGHYMTMLVEILNQTFKVSLVAPCGLFGSIRWQTAQLETLAHMGSLKDVIVGDPELDDVFIFDFSDEEGARRFLSQSRTKAVLQHSFNAGTEFITLTPSAITIKWGVVDGMPGPDAVRELLDGLLGLAELSRKVKAETGARPNQRLAQGRGAASDHKQDVQRDSASALGAAAAGAQTGSALGVGAGAGVETGSALGVGAGAGAGAGAVLGVGAGAGVETGSALGAAAGAGAETGSALGAAAGAGAETGSALGAGEAAEIGLGAGADAVLGSGPGGGAPEEEVDVRRLLESGATDSVAARIVVDPKALAEVVSLLGDFSLRGAAAKALAGVGAAAVPALVDRCADLLMASSIRELLSEAGPEVHSALVKELEQRTDERQIEFLLDMVERLHIREAAPVVRRLADHSSFMVRAKAEQLAAKLG